MRKMKEVTPREGDPKLLLEEEEEELHAVPVRAADLLKDSDDDFLRMSISSSRPPGTSSSQWERSLVQDGQPISSRPSSSWSSCAAYLLLVDG